MPILHSSRQRRLAGFVTSLSLAAILNAPASAGPPFRTDDPEPVAYQHWEMLLYSQGTHIRGSTAATLPGLEVNYGTLPNLQLHAIVPLAYANGASGRSGFGSGDLELGAKYRFIVPKDDDWFPEVGVFPTFEVPTGNQTVSPSTGHVQIYLPLWLQKDFGPWSVYGGGGYWINPGIGNRNFWFFGAAFWRQVTARFHLGAEVFHQTVSVAGGNPVTGMNVGAIYDVSEKWHVLGSVGTALQHPATSGQFAWYAALQFTF
jgi:hypothetical protein